MNVDHGPDLAVAVLGVAGRRGEPALCVVAESTWTVGDGADRRLEVQPAVELAGTWYGEPGASTPLDPPACPVPKAGCDVILRGHAVASADRVEIRVGPVRAALRVHGDRTWERRWTGLRASEPAAWERIPLVWERAAGGPANPLGCAAPAEGDAVPNLDADGPGPAGTAWTIPAFAHRRDLDAFDPRAANAAAPGLVADRLAGGEPALVTGCTATPWTFRLPARPAPRIRIARRHGDLQPAAVLDTVLLDADARTVRLTWRAWVLVDGHELVTAVEIA